MLHVILQILAIIGIVLLCILGLLLVLVLLVLFVPVRYRIRGSKSEKEILLEAKASFLLHILTARFDYPKPEGFTVRLFGIKLFSSGVKETEKEKKESVKRQKEEQQDKEEPATEQEEEKQVREEIQETEQIQEEKQATVQQKEGTKMLRQELPHTTKSPSKKEEAEKKTVFLKHPIIWLQEKIQKIKEIFAKIWYTIKSICDKIKHIAENISYYKNILTDIDNQRLYKRVWCRLLKVLESIRPRVIKADVQVGTGSPDTTGYLCALYGMLLPVLGNNVNMEADFEKAVLNGNIYLKGKITIFTLLHQVGRILLDKQLRIFIRQLKREE